MVITCGYSRCSSFNWDLNTDRRLSQIEYNQLLIQYWGWKRYSKKTVHTWSWHLCSLTTCTAYDCYLYFWISAERSAFANYNFNKLTFVHCSSYLGSAIIFCQLAIIIHLLPVKAITQYRDTKYLFAKRIMPSLRKWYSQQHVTLHLSSQKMHHQIVYLNLSTESHLALYERPPLVSVEKRPNFPAQMNIAATTSISIVHSNFADNYSSFNILSIPRHCTDFSVFKRH